MAIYLFRVISLGLFFTYSRTIRLYILRKIERLEVNPNLNRNPMLKSIDSSIFWYIFYFFFRFCPDTLTHTSGHRKPDRKENHSIGGFCMEQNEQRQHNGNSEAVHACGILWRRRQQVANDSDFILCFFLFLSNLKHNEFYSLLWLYDGKTTHQKPNDSKRIQIKIPKSNVKMIIKNKSGSNNSHGKRIKKYPRDRGGEGGMSGREGSFV